MKEKVLAFAALLPAALGSVCCIGPAAAALLGAGAFGAAAWFEAWRPYLLAAAAGLLAAAFYLSFRNRAQPQCEGGACAPPPPAASRRRLLWLAGGFAALLAAFPYYSGSFWEAAPAASTALASAPSVGRPALLQLDVEGMTCEGCAAGIEATLSRRAGVTKIEASYENSAARVWFDPARIKEQELIQAFEELGYKARPARTAEESP